MSLGFALGSLYGSLVTLAGVLFVLHARRTDTEEADHDL